MLAEPAMGLTDAGYRLANSTGHPGASAFGGGPSSSRTTAQTKGSGEFSNEEVALGRGLRGPLVVAEVAGLLDVVIDVGEASAVSLPGSGVEHLAGVAD